MRSEWPGMFSPAAEIPVLAVISASHVTRSLGQKLDREGKLIHQTVFYIETFRQHGNN